MSHSNKKAHSNRANKFPSAPHPLSTAIPLVLALGSASALAENKVEIFGIIDVGMLYQSKSDPTGNSKTSMETSGLRQTVLGFKGDRDLGNGLQGFFNLEAHFDTNNGMFHGSGDAAGTGSPFFRRQANVGLRGDWGSVTMGRQYGPALLAHIGTEPRAFKEQFSNLYAWAYNQLAATNGPVGTERNTNNDVGIFFNNAVQYRNTIDKLSFGVLWAVGGQPGSTTDNSAFAAGVAYNGPITLSGSYQVIKDQATGTDNVEHAGLGFAVPLGDVTLKANYLNAKNQLRDGTTVSDVDAIGAGVDWKWHPKNTLTLAYYDNKDSRNETDHTRNWVLSNDLALRPDTTIYAQFAYVDAKAGATIKTSIVAAGVPSVGNKTALFNVGINYAF